MAYGICTNKYNDPKCQLALDKVRQVADKTNFVCEKCGKPLKEVPPPPPDPWWKRLWKRHKKQIIAAIAVIALVAAWVLSHKSWTNSPTSVIGPDTIKVENPTDTLQVDSVDTGQKPPEKDTISKPVPPTKKVFGGKATYDSLRRLITIQQTLTITDSEGKAITLSKGDKIQGVVLRDGSLTHGECIVGGEYLPFDGDASIK